jgi:hypothetical protein
MMHFFTVKKQQKTPGFCRSSLYERSVAIWQTSLSRGTLTGEDATKPQAIAQRIAECNVPAIMGPQRSFCCRS